METIEKINIKEIKSDIKAKVEEQKFYKNQRKTVHKDCSRKEGDPADIEPWVATMKHQENREYLRILYAVYGVARGKSYSYVENHYPEDEHPLHQYQWKIDQILKKYRYEVPVEPQEEE